MQSWLAIKPFVILHLSPKVCFGPELSMLSSSRLPAAACTGECTCTTTQLSAAPLLEQ